MPQSISTKVLTIAAALMGIGLATCCAADDIVIADFEGDTYGNWKVIDDAFGAGPAHGGLPNPWRSELHTPVDGFKGKGFASSYHLGEAGTGSLSSPEFKIERKYISFLIGGSKVLAACMNLVIGGTVVRVAGASGDLPDGSETLVPGSWDVAEFTGQSAVIQIEDGAPTRHISVDQIVQSDVKPTSSDSQKPQLQLFADARRDFKIQKRYLHIPIKNSVLAHPGVNTIIDGKVVAKNTIGLADDTPDWWASMDVGASKGKTLTLQVEKMVASSKALESIEQSDFIKAADTLYREPLRAQLHFSPRRGWNNDPNGLVFSQGEYHLYYQHNPYGCDWGNMHWGHAVSNDMVHWQELPIAIYPHAPDDSVYSGSAVVDRTNTSGWRNGPADLIVAAFTSSARGECIVYSNDKGRTFTEFDGVATNKKWVLTAANSDYRVGTFDGRNFTPETAMLKGHLCEVFIAAQTFSHDPKGRTIQIGWLQLNVTGMPFSQAMSLPNQLTLHSTPDGPRLVWAPVDELKSLRVKSHTVGALTLAPGVPNPLAKASAELLDLRTTFTPPAKSEVKFTLRGVPIIYNAEQQDLAVQNRCLVSGSFLPLI